MEREAEFRCPFCEAILKSPASAVRHVGVSVHSSPKCALKHLWRDRVPCPSRVPGCVPPRRFVETGYHCVVDCQLDHASHLQKERFLGKLERVETFSPRKLLVSRPLAVMVPEDRVTLHPSADEIEELEGVQQAAPQVQPAQPMSPLEPPPGLPPPSAQPAPAPQVRQPAVAVPAVPVVGNPAVVPTTQLPPQIVSLEGISGTSVPQGTTYGTYTVVDPTCMASMPPPYTGSPCPWAPAGYDPNAKLHQSVAVASPTTATMMRDQVGRCSIIMPGEADGSIVAHEKQLAELALNTKRMPYYALQLSPAYQVPHPEPETCYKVSVTVVTNLSPPACRTIGHHWRGPFNYTRFEKEILDVAPAIKKAKADYLDHLINVRHKVAQRGIQVEDLYVRVTCRPWSGMHRTKFPEGIPYSYLNKDCVLSNTVLEGRYYVFSIVCEVNSYKQYNDYVPKAPPASVAPAVAYGPDRSRPEQKTPWTSGGANKKRDHHGQSPRREPPAKARSTSEPATDAVAEPDLRVRIEDNRSHPDPSAPPKQKQPVHPLANRPDPLLAAQVTHWGD